MPKFEPQIMSAETKRQDFANRTLDGFWSDYKRPEINERVTERMQALGFSAAVLDTVFNPDTYIVLNMSHGNFTSMTFGTKPLIGVLALNGGETVRLALDSHPLQHTKIPTSIASLEYLPNAGALVHNMEKSYRTSNGDFAVNKGRPVLALRYSDTTSEAHPSTVLHEFTHLAQVLHRSTRHFSSTSFSHPERIVDSANDEFEAYDMQEYVYGDDPDSVDHPALEAAHRVALFRKYRLTNTSRMLDLDNLSVAMDSALLDGIVPQSKKK